MVERADPEEGVTVNVPLDGAASTEKEISKQLFIFIFIYFILFLPWEPEENPSVAEILTV